MEVILDHSTDRDLKMKRLQHALCHIYLPTASVHKDQIRKCMKTAEFLSVLLLFKSVRKSSRQHFFHTCVIIWALHALNLEFAIIIPFRFSSLIHNHRTNRSKSTRIGNIISFHSHDSLQSEKRFNLFYSANGSSFLTFDSLFIFCQNHKCILPCKLHQFFFLSLLRHGNTHPMTSAASEPLFQKLCLFHFRLQHQFSRNIRCTRIELLNKTLQNLSIASSPSFASARISLSS